MTLYKKTLTAGRKEVNNMKDCLIIVLIGLVLGIVFFRPLGKLFDMDNGDYKRNNMEVLK